MKRNILNLVFGILFIGTVTGCDNNTTTLDNGNKIESKGKCTATECIEKINVENTVEEINEIIGFEGELTDENYNKYYWELSEDSGIEVTYYSGEKGTIEVVIENDLLANKNVDFSKYDELQTKVKEGINYNDFISYIGNVKGTLIEKSSYSNKYLWVAEDGSYLKATFSSSSGDCTFVTGYVY